MYTCVLCLRVMTCVSSSRVSREVVRQEESGGGVGEVGSHEVEGFRATQGEAGVSCGVEEVGGQGSSGGSVQRQVGSEHDAAFEGEGTGTVERLPVDEGFPGGGDTDVGLPGREGVTDEDRLKLFSLYAMHLKDVGRVPRDHFQALQGDFAAMFKPTGLFADRRILLARSCEYRWQGMELSINADENKKWPVTYSMIEDIFRHSWGVGYGCMAFAAKVAMYEWGLRISETSKIPSTRRRGSSGPRTSTTMR